MALEGIPEDFDWASLNGFGEGERVVVPGIDVVGTVHASLGYVVLVTPDDGTAMRAVECVWVERA
jgi:hypothetical protein